MDQHLIARRFLSIVGTLTPAALEEEIRTPRALLMASAAHRGRHIAVAYAPFDHINPGAKIVIVGITPGRQQMAAALREAHRVLARSGDVPSALAAAKVHASFAGPMRSNLVSMLDSIGIAGVLGIDTTASLWAERSELAHFTSALRYPVFLDGENYSGTPAILTTLALRDQLAYLRAEMALLPNALFVPLGPKVAKVLLSVAAEAGVPRKNILDGIQHPSGANAERIACFLGTKAVSDLSAKTNGSAILAARVSLSARITALSP